MFAATTPTGTPDSAAATATTTPSYSNLAAKASSAASAATTIKTAPTDSGAAAAANGADSNAYAAFSWATPGKAAASAAATRNASPTARDCSRDTARDAEWTGAKRSSGIYDFYRPRTSTDVSPAAAAATTTATAEQWEHGFQQYAAADAAAKSTAGSGGEYEHECSKRNGAIWPARTKSPAAATAAATTVQPQALAELEVRVIRAEPLGNIVYFCYTLKTL